MKGKIGCDSFGKNYGSTFWCTINLEKEAESLQSNSWFNQVQDQFKFVTDPILTPRSGEVSPVSFVSRESSPIYERKIKALICDPCELVRKIIREYLEALGLGLFEIRETFNFDQTLEILEKDLSSSLARFYLVFISEGQHIESNEQRLSNEFPDVWWIRMLIENKTLKKEPREKNMPATAAIANNGSQKHAIQFSQTINKPVKLSQLISVIMKVIKIRLEGEKSTSLGTLVPDRYLKDHPDEITFTSSGPTGFVTEETMILVVEDNKTNQMIARKFLQKLGYKCDIANNGQEAIEMFSKQNAYKLILMDFQVGCLNHFWNEGAIIVWLFLFIFLSNRLSFNY